MGLRDEIERIFGLWLEWSDDEEILALLDLVVATLRQRTYQVSYDVRRSSREQDESGG